ncbi:YraN family protein [Helicobacter aurati]|uniref:UPF0102 protein CQA66_06175 n=1 Tax=Helicobacter aurati TaxID=137778 RepID=A0A3D8J323_9HELI|nr:YraN family protein [Helicobacter aurati]RDU71545.1 YraN family protein [Helicobacter aurati]
MKKNTRKIGTHYEEIALQYLSDRGFSFIAKNFYSRYGEIDLIMQKEEVLHFIEVKSATSLNPLIKITPTKLEKMIKTIYVFLAKHHYSCSFCLDALAIQGKQILFIENITI